MVMELMPPSMSKVLNDAKYVLEPAHMIKFAFQIASAMHYLHSQQPRIVHRDLKPGNVLVDEGLQTCKIIDFGLASVKDAQKGSQKTGKEKGTPAFMAPELFLEGGSRSVDYHSYGMLIWNIFTRTSPFSDQVVGQIVLLVGQGKRPDVTLVPVPWVQEVIAHCWEQEPSDRWSFAMVLDFLSKHASLSELV
eukprot:m.260960 g.260960  ORF g.260960 m.260960 type:complete len:192 (+) comp26780_c1_seq18:1866-2441(+)